MKSVSIKIEIKLYYFIQINKSEATKNKLSEVSKISFFYQKQFYF
jgi:hypothetical protein